MACMKNHKRVMRQACVAFGLAASGGVADCAEPPMSGLPTDTQRILSAIEERATKYSGADRRAAESLSRDGERAYRKSDFSAAWSAFSNSYPNFPTPFAYVMTGDSHWRAVLQFARARAASSNGQLAGRQTCGLSNERFTHNLLMDLDQHHEVGLALAAGANGGTLPSEPFLQRAQATASCLRSLGTRYATQPRTACVELAALADCLGAPLPLAGEVR